MGRVGAGVGFREGKGEEAGGVLEAVAGLASENSRGQYQSAHAGGVCLYVVCGLEEGWGAVGGWDGVRRTRLRLGRRAAPPILQAWTGWHTMPTAHPLPPLQPPHAPPTLTSPPPPTTHTYPKSCPQLAFKPTSLHQRADFRLLQGGRCRSGRAPLHPRQVLPRGAAPRRYYHRSVGGGRGRRGRGGSGSGDAAAKVPEAALARRGRRRLGCGRGPGGGRPGGSGRSSGLLPLLGGCCHLLGCAFGLPKHALHSPARGGGERLRQSGSA